MTVLVLYHNTQGFNLNEMSVPGDSKYFAYPETRQCSGSGEQADEWVPDEEIISEFANDWCLCLAMHLHKKHGYPLAYIRASYRWGMFNTDIFHVVVRISEDIYLDITGLHTQDQLIQKYRKELETTIRVTDEYVDLDYEYRGEFRIDKIADRLVELYLQ